jgi:light-regulated signal transduction histidine kinase (bacteriophytochrome)
VNQLARVLNNLRQLHRVAEIDGDEGPAGLLTAAAVAVEDAITRAPARLGAHAAEALAGLVEAGGALNALAHRANTAEEVPPANELHAILDQVHSAVHNAVH